MDPLATKGLVGLGGLSLIGGGGALAWNQGLFSRSPETIKDKLERKGYTALEEGSSHWSQIFEIYKKTENTKRFANDGITSGDTEHDKLKKKCNEALDLESSKEDIYQRVIKWCVVPRKVEEVISSVSLLGVDESSDSDNYRWKPILEEYKRTKSQTGNTYELTEVTLVEPTEGNTKEAENIKELKKGCKSRREKLTYHLEFEKSMEEVRKWCSAK
ncbi:hypothetical protein HF1_13480 [Mycoplasma haemofelis str. Langford 1]|uniref:Uncharacterized protein n=1 Tax=Mycoplasma haemofelis (strain Langford 1) TaxID=941640 RepID=E8ZJN5_MYCHL|nr:hypothetical protein [Mycoplasma haemofelis]CBY93356.1 hypothetical protein HF1_13480 [Mycoplasma haemofelis str. Langford 1]